MARVAQILDGLTESVQIQHLVAGTDYTVESELHGKLLLLRLQSNPLRLKGSQHFGGFIRT